MNKGDDVVLWPNGIWCFWYEIEEYNWLSDDYEIIKMGNSRWNTIVNE